MSVVHGVSYCFFAVMGISAWAINGQAYEDSYRLEQDLFRNYSRSIRPLRNQSHVLSVSPSFEIIALVSLDAVAQTIVVNGLVVLQWKDELLTWDPAAYNGVRYFNPELSSIWIPRMAVLNTMDERDMFEDKYAPIQLDYKGNVVWSPGGLFPSSCLLDLRQFPLDVHDCGLTLAPIYMNSSDMIYNMTSARVIFNAFIPNGEWDITASDIYETPLYTGDDIQYRSVTIELTIKRKATFFILNVFLPVILLSGLNILSFVIPATEGKGEKIEFSVSVLLAMSVYMGIVSDGSPSNSENLPYVTYYIFLLFSLCVLCCVDNIIIVWVHHKEEEEEKKQKMQGHIENMSKKLKSMTTLPQIKSSGDRSKIFPAPDEIQEETTIFEEQIENRKSDAEKRLINKYKDMAYRLNYYSTIVFSIISTIFTIVVFVMIGGS